MKKKLLALLLSVSTIVTFAGCGTTQTAETAPNDIELPYYVSEEELPDDAYYIVHQTKNETRYYPLYQAPHTFEDANDSAKGELPNRITWVNYNIDEGYIPTFYEGDKMIYKSSTVIPTKYALEKFYDDGYSFGVSGLMQDISKNYKYDPESGGYVMPSSDAIGFDTLDADSIYFVSFRELTNNQETEQVESTENAENNNSDGWTKVETANVSPSGTVMDLKPLTQYQCDIRTGTEKVDAVLTSNIHCFSSAETYMFGTFTFITEHIAELNIPEYVTAGYYNMNGGGFYRYLPNVKTEKEAEKLDADYYNETIYTYNKDGQLEGTKIGYVFDENGFLIHASETDESSNAMSELEEGIVTDDDLTIFSKDIKIMHLNEAKSYASETTSGVYYEMEANVVDTTKFLNIRYYLPDNSTYDVIPVEGGIYSVVYTKDDGSYFEISEDYPWMITEIVEKSVPEVTDETEISDETTEENTEEITGETTNETTDETTETAESEVDETDEAVDADDASSSTSRQLFGNKTSKPVGEDE
jgi:hypothetical protein